MISDGATVSLDYLVMSAPLTARASLTIEGVGTTVSGVGNIGMTRGGSLYILDGAQVSNQTANLGHGSGSADIVISGANSVWTINGDMNLGGNRGQASLVISDGAVVTNDAVLLALAESPTTLTVSGAGTRWISSGLVTIGKYSSYGATGANVSISDGAYVESEGAILGMGGAHGAYVETGAISMGASGATTSINVTGVGSRFIDMGPNAKYNLAGSDAFTITGAPLPKDAAALEVEYLCGRDAKPDDGA